MTSRELINKYGILANKSLGQNFLHRDDIIDMIADASCGITDGAIEIGAGLGVLSRKPEIRYKDDLIDTNLSDIQYKILCESAKYLKKGGRLVYSTCTLNPEENNKNTAKFLAQHTDFEGVKLELPPAFDRAFDEEPYEITLMPYKADGDGFYIAVFTRR